MLVFVREYDRVFCCFCILVPVKVALFYIRIIYSHVFVVASHHILFLLDKIEICRLANFMSLRFARPFSYTSYILFHILFISLACKLLRAFGLVNSLCLVFAWPKPAPARHHRTRGHFYLVCFFHFSFAQFPSHDTRVINIYIYE